jgi:uncharacterized membrane protein YesL
MWHALKVFRQAINEFERYGWLYVFANLISALLSLLIITAPAAYAALSRLSHTAQTEATATYSDFWGGFRDHFWRGLVVGVANLIIIGILWSNFTTYGNRSDWSFIVLRAIWIAILTLWLGMQFYLWPLLDEMEQPNLSSGFRNAIVMFLSNPLFTFSLIIMVGIVAIISAALVIPWLLFTSSLIACIANTAVLDRVTQFRTQRGPN